MNRIAVWNTAFLGDAVLTLPLLQNLRRHFPEAEIDFHVRAGLAGLFEAHPAVSRVVAHDKRGAAKGLPGLLACGRDLASRRYSLWISAHTSLRSAFLARLSGAPERIGYDRPRAGALLYTRTVARRFGELAEIERLLELLRPLGVPAESCWPEIVLDPAVREEAARFFAALDRPVLGLHPGSVWATKRWPARYFAEIGRLALQEGAAVVLFAGPGEEEVACAVRQALSPGLRAKDALRDLSGALSLPRLAAYLGCLSCYVGNDSGPLHLAWPQGTPVTAVFGPTVRELGFFPRGTKATVFEAPLACRPCGLHGHAACPLGHHRCMEEVTPEQVWPDVRAKLFA